MSREIDNSDCMPKIYRLNRGDSKSLNTVLDEYINGDYNFIALNEITLEILRDNNHLHNMIKYMRSLLDLIWTPMSFSYLQLRFKGEPVLNSDRDYFDNIETIRLVSSSNHDFENNYAELNIKEDKLKVHCGVTSISGECINIEINRFASKLFDRACRGIAL